MGDSERETTGEGELLVKAVPVRELCIDIVNDSAAVVVIVTRAVLLSEVDADSDRVARDDDEKEGGTEIEIDARGLTESDETPDCAAVALKSTDEVTDAANVFESHGDELALIDALADLERDAERLEERDADTEALCVALCLGEPESEGEREGEPLPEVDTETRELNDDDEETAGDFDALGHTVAEGVVRAEKLVVSYEEIEIDALPL